MPRRDPMLPYGRQSISEADIEAVVEVLRGDWLTTGPRVAEFEAAVAKAAGATFGVAVSNGTTALHAAYAAAGIGRGDEVIVPAITFPATANAALYQGAKPIFVDVEEDTLLLDPEKVSEAITPATKAVVGVDFAGQPADYEALGALAADAGATLIADAAHALGASQDGRPVGSLADLTTFSFHPVKHITTAEGGMVVTDDEKAAEFMRRFRNHGITTDHRQRQDAGSFRYDMIELGNNYRLSDLQCALGLSQMPNLPAWVEKRQAIARRYRSAFAKIPGITSLRDRPGVQNSHHLFVVRIIADQFGMDRDQVFHAMREAGFGVNVHYLPVHLHPYYRRTLFTGPGLCPVAEQVYEEILSLPVFPAMTDGDVDDVVAAFHALAD